MTLRWRRDGEDFVLESSVPVLRHRRPRLGPSGVVDPGLLRRKTWHWPNIAVVTWDDASGGYASLAVCLYGDPYTKILTMNGFLWDARSDRVRVLLEPIRPLVEAMGARVEDRDEPATRWWYLDPDARRAQ